MQQILKIVVTGSYAAGKTNFIRAVSDIETVDTDYAVTPDEERLLKGNTTVALDFGTIAIEEGLTLYLFGTPGQERFDFMWEVLSRGCLGYVVMVDSCRPESFAECRRLMDSFAELTQAPFVVAANKQDDPRALSPAEIHAELHLPGWVRVLPCVATDKESVKTVLLTLLETIISLLPEEDLEYALEA